MEGLAQEEFSDNSCPAPTPGALNLLRHAGGGAV